MSRELPFDPLPFLHDPHKQTLISAFFNLVKEPKSEQKLVKLPCGDRISLEVTTPSGWKEGDLIVVMVHGLCGSHRSPYLVRMAKCLESIGVKAVRYNMRGCGSGKGLAKGFYHGGRTEDLFECFKVLKKEHPTSSIILIGFSLGGNIALKLAGELGELAPYFFESLIAVSPPVDLYSSVKMLGDPSNRMYEDYFYSFLRSEVLELHEKFLDLPRVHLPKGLKIYEFDQIYTAPFCGFSSAFDYYEKCSSIHFIDQIRIPAKILFSEDDPIISAASLDGKDLPEHIEIYKTKKGGHMGYLGRGEGQRGFFWLDRQLLSWIEAIWKGPIDEEPA